MPWNNDNDNKWFLSRCFSYIISFDTGWKHFYETNATSLVLVYENQGSGRFATLLMLIDLVNGKYNI